MYCTLMKMYRNQVLMSLLIILFARCVYVKLSAGNLMNFSCMFSLWLYYTCNITTYVSFMKIILKKNSFSYVSMEIKYVKFAKLFIHAKKKTNVTVLTFGLKYKYKTLKLMK